MKQGIECPECGQRIPLMAASGICPACLLKLAMGKDPTGEPDTSVYQSGDTKDDIHLTDFSLKDAREIEAFVLLEEIGRGGLGAVCKAKHLRLERIVALKVIVDGKAARKARHRFETEARVLARLQHPNIVRDFVR